MADRAIIFDVDGVLLELTRDEEELFFISLSKFVPTENLSRDWNSYKIRNDENIIAEILERNDLPLSLATKVIEHYTDVLKRSTVKSVPITGATELLATFKHQTKLGIATANLLEVAKHRLQQAELWQPVSEFAFGADGGGHKTEILGRVLSKIQLPPDRVIYIGDNINDVDAGLFHGVHFIGFSTDPSRLDQLKSKGCRYAAQNHQETKILIQNLLP